MTVHELRKEIDAVDIQIVRLIEERMRIVSDIAVYKQKNGLPVYDKSREEQKLIALQNEASPENKADVAELFALIMEQSKKRQEIIRNG